jgi:hypothetical protein
LTRHLMRMNELDRRMISRVWEGITSNRVDVCVFFFCVRRVKRENSEANHGLQD